MSRGFAADECGLTPRTKSVTLPVGPKGIQEVCHLEGISLIDELVCKFLHSTTRVVAVCADVNLSKKVCKRVSKKKESVSMKIAKKKIAKHRAAKVRRAALIKEFECKPVIALEPAKANKYAALMGGNFSVETKKLRPKSVFSLVEKKELLEVIVCAREWRDSKKAIADVFHHDDYQVLRVEYDHWVDHIKMELIGKVSDLRDRKMFPVVEPPNRESIRDLDVEPVMQRIQKFLEDPVGIKQMSSEISGVSFGGLDQLKSSLESLGADVKVASENVTAALPTHGSVGINNLADSLRESVERLSSTLENGVNVKVPEGVEHKFKVPSFDFGSLSISGILDKITGSFSGFTTLFSQITSNGINSRTKDFLCVLVIGLSQYILNKYELSKSVQLSVYGAMCLAAYITENPLVKGMVSGMLVCDAAVFLYHYLKGDDKVVAVMNLGGVDINNSELVTSIVTTGLLAITGLTGLSGVTTFLQGCTLFQRYANGLDFTFNKLTDIFMECMRLMGKPIGLEWFKSAYSKFPEIYEISDKLKTIEDRIVNAEGVKAPEVSLFRELSRRHSELAKKIPNTNDFVVYHRQILVIASRLKALEAAMKMAGAFAGKMRKRAPTVGYVGPSQIGKSVLAECMANAYAEKFFDKERFENYQLNSTYECVHFKPNEFVDEWKIGSSICIWDDWGQDKKATDAEKCNGRILINLQNNSPWLINKSALQEKNTTYAEHELFIYTTNVQTVDLNTYWVTELPAVTNRLEGGWKVWVKEQYRKMIGPNENWDYEVDWNKVEKGKLTTDLYEFQRMTYKYTNSNVKETGHVYGPKLSWEEHLRFVLPDIKFKLDKQELYLRMLTTMHTNRNLNPLIDVPMDVLMTDYFEDPFFVGEVPAQHYFNILQPGEGAYAEAPRAAVGEEVEAAMYRTPLHDAYAAKQQDERTRNEVYQQMLNVKRGQGVPMWDINRNPIMSLEANHALLWHMCYAEDQQWLRILSSRLGELDLWFNGPSPFGTPFNIVDYLDYSWNHLGILLYHQAAPTSIAPCMKMYGCLIHTFYVRLVRFANRTGWALEECFNHFMNLSPQQVFTQSAKTLYEYAVLNTKDLMRSIYDLWSVHATFGSFWNQELIGFVIGFVGTLCTTEKMVAASNYVKLKTRFQPRAKPHVTPVAPHVVNIQEPVQSVMRVVPESLIQKMRSVQLYSNYFLEHDGVVLQNIIGVYDRFFLVTNHAIQYLNVKLVEDPAMQVYIISHANVHDRRPVLWKYATVCPQSLQDKAIVYFHPLSGCNQTADIRHFFLDKGVSVTAGSGVVAQICGVRNGIPEQTCYCADVQLGVTNYTGPTDDRYTVEGYALGIKGQFGNCSSPLWLSDERFPGKEFIIGFMVAAAPQSVHKIAWFTKLDREWIDRAIKSIMDCREVEPVSYIPKDVSSLKEVTIPVDEEEEKFFPNNLTIVDVLPGTRAPYKTVLRPTAFQTEEIFGPCETVPSFQRPFINEKGEFHDPLLDSMAGYSAPPKCVNPLLARVAVSMYASIMLPALKRGKPPPEIPSFDEAVIGWRTLEGVPRNTGVGYELKRAGKSKASYFGVGRDRTFTEDYYRMKELALFDIKTAEQGIAVVRPYDDFLKPDEALLIEKVINGKARLVSGSDMRDVIEGKIYYGDEMAAIVANPVTCGMTIGMNPLSSDWHVTGEILRNYKLIAGDVKGFDKEVADWEHSGVHEQDTMYYSNATPKERTFRNVYRYKCSNSIHVCHLGHLDIKYRIKSSVDSGGYTTLKDNSQLNNNRIRYIILCAWVKRYLGIDPLLYDESYPELPYCEIENDIFVITCGDDHVIGVKDSMEWFTHQDMAQGCEDNGWTYTDEQKRVGADVPPHRSVEEITFCKRRWEWDVELQRWRAPLAWLSLVNSLYWTADLGLSMPQNIDQFTRELAEHGYVRWREVYPILEKASIELYDHVPKYRTWHDAINARASFDAKLYAEEIQDGDEVLLQAVMNHPENQVSPVLNPVPTGWEETDAWGLDDYDSQPAQSPSPNRDCDQCEYDARQLMQSKCEMLMAMDNYARAFALWSADIYDHEMRQCVNECMDAIRDLADKYARDWRNDHQFTHDHDPNGDDDNLVGVEDNPGPEVNKLIFVSIVLWVVSLVLNFKTNNQLLIMKKFINEDKSLRGFGLSLPVIEMASPLLEAYQDYKCSACGDSAVVVEEKITTEFVDQGEKKTFMMADNDPLEEYSNAHTTLQDFFAKPQYMGTTTWNVTGQPANTILTYFEPESVLIGDDLFNSKYRGFNLVRATAHIKFQLNANRFQQGMLLMHFIPNANHRATPLVNTYNYNLVTKTQQPSMIMNARDDSMEFVIPWVAPSLYYDIKNQEYGWGNLYVSVLSPLATDGANVQTADLAAWIWFEDVQFAAPSVPQMAIGKSEKKAADEAKPVSTMLLASSRVVSSMGFIPMLSSYIEPVSWALKSMSTVAAAFGYSKPSVAPSPTVVSNQFNRYLATADGPDLGIPMGLSCENEVQKIDTISARLEDEMSFNFLKKVETLVFTQTWSTGDIAGTPYPFGANGFSPAYFFTSGSLTVGSHTANFNVGPPIWYLSQLFTFWRGSFEVVIRFAKTEFHTGRLLITWTPTILTTGAAIPTPATSSYSLREIVDLKYTSEITLKLPYLLPFNYVNMSQPSGQFQISVLTELKAPETCAQNVQMLLFLKGGDDFEFAAPLGDGFLQQPVLAVMATGMTSSSLITAKMGPDQNIPPLSSMHSKQCMGENFTSLKQLLSRAHSIQSSNAPLSNQGGFNVYPWFAPILRETTTGIVNGCGYGGDIYSIVAPMYGFFRGGMNVSVYFGNNWNPGGTAPIAQGGYGVLATLVNDVSVSAGSPPVTGPVNYGLTSIQYNYWANTASYSTSGFACADNTTGYCTFNVPYYSSARMSINLPDYFGSQGTYAGDQSSPPVRLNLLTPNQNYSYSILRATRDDFQFSYFIACPPLLTSFT